MKSVLVVSLVVSPKFKLLFLLGSRSTLVTRRDLKFFSWPNVRRGKFCLKSDIFNSIYPSFCQWHKEKLEGRGHDPPPPSARCCDDRTLQNGPGMAHEHPTCYFRYRNTELLVIQFRNPFLLSSIMKCLFLFIMLPSVYDSSWRDQYSEVLSAAPRWKT